MITRKISFYSFLTLFFIAAIQIPQVEAQQQQDMKIGFVEPRVVLERMPEMRAVQQRIQNFVERKSQELSEMERNLQTEIQLYQEKVGVISQEAQRREEERLSQMDLELRETQSRFQREVQERRQREMAPLLEQMQEAINEVARKRNMDYVLNTTTSQGDVIILYVKEELLEEYDITDAVMRELGI